MEIITCLDDHSRYALHICAHDRVTAQVVLTTFRATVAQDDRPASTLTDNAMVYTLRQSCWTVHTAGRPRNAFETELAVLGVQQKNGRGNHPQTQGRVERFQQTMSKWLTAQPDQPEDIPPSGPCWTPSGTCTTTTGRTAASADVPPAAAYTTLPKATPGEPTDRTHTRCGPTRSTTARSPSDAAGPSTPIGIGRRHNGTPVRALVHDLEITIIDATTGELLRQLTLDPTRRYQPQTPRNP